MSKSTDDMSSTCSLCYQDVKIYAIGACDHPICHVCSTRMRALCQQMYCPVCRAELQQVVFMDKLHLYKGIITHRFPRDRDTKIYFQNNRVRLEFNKLLQHQCSICVNRLSDGNFKMLQDHVRKEHELFYCDLCLEFLKIFTSERKCYTRRDLAQHRRKGDPDDKSYKGHPLCEFCDKRYFDNDELLKHLRKDHYFCHFCESTGISNQFYNDYPSLREHFQAQHYLCEEGDCQFEQFSHAFASDIDFKAHRAAVHSKGFSKFQARQNRQIDVEINLPPRTRDRRGGSPSVGRGRAHLLRDDSDDEDTFRAIQASLRTSRTEEDGRRRQKEGTVRRKNNQKAREEDVEDALDVRLDPHIAREKPKRNQTMEQAGKSQPKERRKDESMDIPLERSEKDFPKLLDQEVDQNSPFVTSWGKPQVKIEDFPGLNPSAQTAPPANQPQVQSTWRPQRTDSLKEYPTLGGGTDKVRGVDKATGVDKAVRNSHTTRRPQRTDSLKEYPTLGGGTDKVSVVDKVRGVDKATGVDKAVRNSHTTRRPQKTDSLKEYPTLGGGTDKGTGVDKAVKNSHTTKPTLGSRVIQSQVQNTKEKPHQDTPPVLRQIPPQEQHLTSSHPSNFQAKPEEFPSLSSIATFLNKDSSSNKKPDTTVKGRSDWKRPVVEGNPPPSKKGPNKTESVGNNKTEEAHSVRPPPGFSGQLPRNPLGPPPGFASSSADSQLQQKPSFVPPEDYKDRNRTLVHRIKKCLKDKEGGFNQFRTLSGEFRSNLLSAQDYYDRCLLLLGDDFCDIFEELVSLLPDVEKQQELLFVHSVGKNKRSQGGAVLKISKNNSTMAWKETPQNKHKTCTQCRQMVLIKDFEDHLNSHQDFPALSSAAPVKAKPGVPSQTAWGRMK